MMRKNVDESERVCEETGTIFGEIALILPFLF